jgi:hypothetical protein
MKRTGIRPPTRSRSAFSGALIFAAILGLVAVGAVARPSVAHATVARGIADPFFEYMLTPDAQKPGIHEIAHDLGAGYIRFFVSWASAEPSGPSIGNPTYMAQVASAVDIARYNNLKVILTFNEVPEWASDSALWKYSGASGSTPKYSPNEAMSAAHLADFQNFCQTIAAQFQGEVWGYEVWNEPNLALFLSPQLYPGHPHFSSDLYVEMLKSCRAGIYAGTSLPHPYIIAGGTDPRGYNNAGSTAPQTFALRVAAAHVTGLFDYYSHHPYMPGASPRLWPEAAPRDPKTTVTLENLGTLLKIFPTKNFLLTEYGVHTAASKTFSYEHVDQPTQADYLRRAYAYVARYKQVKLLMWYLLKDYKPAIAVDGFYTGLDTASGAHKRAWYVFAGGTTLTIQTPTSVKRGAAAKLTGQLAWKGTGFVAKPVLQSHRIGHPWATVKTLTTLATGAYSVSVKPKASTYYRVAWLGVVTSRFRLVRVH